MRFQVSVNDPEIVQGLFPNFDDLGNIFSCNTPASIRR